MVGRGVKGHENWPKSMEIDAGPINLKDTGHSCLVWGQESDTDLGSSSPTASTDPICLASIPPRIRLLPLQHEGTRDQERPLLNRALQTSGRPSGPHCSALKRRGCPCAADQIGFPGTVWDDRWLFLYRLLYRHSPSVMDDRCWMPILAAVTHLKTPVAGQVAPASGHDPQDERRPLNLEAFRLATDPGPD